MLHKYSTDDVMALVPSRFVRRLTTNRPKKIKPAQTISSSSIIQPNTCKSIERYLNSHASRGHSSRRRVTVSNDVVYPPLDPFPFQHFYTPKGVFEKSKATASLDFMLSKTSWPAAQLVVHMYVEALWFADPNWLAVIKEKMHQYHIVHFRAPRAIISAIRLDRTDIATDLIKHSEPGGLKDVAHALVEDKNISYLEKIVPRLNISSRNDVLFQGVSRLHRQPGYARIWEFLSEWANPYKVVSKMLYMRECLPADYLLSQDYITTSVVNDAWRYVEKTGLEQELPRTSARILNTKISEELSDISESKEKEGGRRKI